MGIVVSDHACQRFLERYCGMEPLAARRSPVRTRWARARILAYWDSFHFGPPRAAKAVVPDWLAPRNDERVFGAPPHLFLTRQDGLASVIVTYWSPLAESASQQNSSSHMAFVMTHDFACPAILRMLGRKALERVATEHQVERVRDYASTILDRWRVYDVDDLLLGCPKTCRAATAPCLTLEPD